MRIGYGYDIHRLVEGRRLILGGVSIPFDKGLEGHSDADVLCHAISDALLGATALGDIGIHFPDTDSEYKDASSLDLLASVVKELSKAGIRIGNVDVTVVAEEPKLLLHREAMAANIARVLGIDVSRVSIKATTNEGLDAVGRGEAIAAHAVTLVEELT